MRVLVTGGAGFIGSHLVDRLLDEGFEVAVVDNLSTGRTEYIEKCLSMPERCRLYICDLKDEKCLSDIEKAPDIVFHLAANPDVRSSYQDPETSFRENIVATFRVLEYMRRRGVRDIIFTSSSTVYGDPQEIPTPEEHPLRPISIYGACKAASELLIQTYSRLYGLRTAVLRLANIIGPRTTHGVIYDLLLKLRRDPRRLEVLGDGSQRKSYLYIDDTIEAMMRVLQRLFIEDRERPLEKVFNIGNTDWITVREIAEIVVREAGYRETEIVYVPQTPDGRGWPGDVKLMLLDIKKISGETGWRPRVSSEEAVRLTARYLSRTLLS